MGYARRYQYYIPSHSTESATGSRAWKTARQAGNLANFVLVIVVLVVSDKPRHHCTQLKDMGSLNTIISGESDGLDKVHQFIVVELGQTSLEYDW